MDLVYLYGPPAVGKLTIAKELAARTGFALFPNHLSIECVLPVFEFGSEPFWRQVRAIREGVLAEAAREGRDLIGTNVYSQGDSDPQLERRFELVEGNGGRVCPVKLSCATAVLEARVVQPERHAVGKLSTVDGLRDVLSEHELRMPIPGRGSLRLDTGERNAAETAKQIIARYELPVTDDSGNA